MLADRRILLIITGGVAAYKALALIRRLREAGAAVRPVLTAGAQHFVTPLAAASLAESKAYTELFDLTDESEMGHIQLSRAANAVLVAPATADILAKMAAGLADDLASTLLLATDKPVFVAPAMNARMWAHPATAANMLTLESWGVRRIGPGSGDLACGEYGDGRMREPEAIRDALAAAFRESGGTLGPPGEAPAAPAGSAASAEAGDVPADQPLAGRRALVTSGPTREPIDPVRFLANRSSGRQGHAIAGALAALGAQVTLVSGPVSLPDPPGVTVEHVETAEAMLAACRRSLPVDVAVCCAAVADWRVADVAPGKMKKDAAAGPPELRLTANPDILASLAAPGAGRPRLVVGFAAETADVLAAARAKRTRKGCDWMLANAVGGGQDGGVFGAETNTVHLLTETDLESWPSQSKDAVAAGLARRIAHRLAAAGGGGDG